MKKTIILCAISIGSIATAKAQSQAVSLKLDTSTFQSQELTIEGKTIKVRAFENRIYVSNPVDTAYQKMNIYIPEAYFNNQTVNGYTAQTAPIFFPNKVGGYMPAKPATTKDNPMGMRPPMNGEMPTMGNRPPEGLPPMRERMPSKPLTVVAALARGYVVASPGVRGRTLKDQNGNFTGKAPAGIVDLKAAVRYLKFNDAVMPGDANKIISNGTSAGGAMSTLLGATGEALDYEPYLNAIGAAKASDAIFAVSAYCPITNLEQADMTYEWQFNGINTYKKGGPFAKNNAQPQELTADQIKVSNELKELFLDYLNSLQLKDKKGNLLSLDKNGNGTFKTLVQSYVMASAQKALDSGVDLSEFPFVKVAQSKVVGLDYEAYLIFIGRQKTPPAFDALDLSSPETQLFGTTTIDNQHFTPFSKTHSTVTATTADDQLVKMMNPMHYIGVSGVATSKHWRIRHGSNDKDTGLGISVMLATLLENNNLQVDLALPWQKPHSGDYDLEELFQWIDGICK
ncbi:subtype B tannase [Flavobacterium sp. IMCC34518]|uniref:subtype B tannase n=1 Tax=Flavobacterium sp. IMCC34518 TaxID=3003623 RepID=UPI0022AC685D|nr:subtype B tannase [Flavobacterium sp. IMCC34518]